MLNLTSKHALKTFVLFESGREKEEEQLSGASGLKHEHQQNTSQSDHPKNYSRQCPSKPMHYLEYLKWKGGSPQGCAQAEVLFQYKPGSILKSKE